MKTAAMNETVKIEEARAIAAQPAQDDRAGIIYAALSFIIWGVIPIYWRLLGPMSAFELTSHRIVWSALFVTLFVWWRGHIARILAVMRQRRLLALLALTSLLIATNWTTYMYCVESHQLVEASLGYYINPLVSIAQGAFLLGERMTRMRMAAIVLATIAVAVQTVELGHFPWIALVLALSFGFYGYFRKLAPVEALDGLCIETWILFPITAAFVGYLWWNGTGVFPKDGTFPAAILIFGGPVTAIPLTLFSVGARRIRLSTLGFLQYLSPSITLLLAVFAFNEKFTLNHAATFGVVWLALILVALEGRLVSHSPLEQIPE